MPADIVIKIRRGTAAEWTSADPTLAAGELGFETDTARSKLGDGTTAWTSLGYTVGDSSGVGTVEWTSVIDKPTEFPPVAHTHTKSEITDFAHTHVINDITDYDVTAGTILSDTAPGSPVAGLKWVKTTTMQQYIYFDSTWVEI